MEYFRKKYSEVELIKKDNWADTYMAINNETQEKVQLKILKSQSNNTKYINSITYEIDQLQNLKNKNLIGINGIYNFIENNIIYYYIETEYFQGKTLSDKMILTGHTCKESLEIIKQVAQGLNEFHYRGLNYETLRGENIFINAQGVTKIDVLSYIQQKYDEEEYDNYDEFEDGIDKDIYAVGVILYQLITRDQNFKLKKLKKNIEDEEVYSILYSLTSKKIKYRYENLNEFLLDVNEYLEKLSYKANKDLEYIYEDDFEAYEHKSNKFVLIKRLSACLAVVLVVTGGIKVVGLVKTDDNKLETQTEIIAEEESIEEKAVEEKPKKEQSDKSTNDYNLNSNTEDDSDEIVQAPSSSNTNNNTTNNNTTNNTNSDKTNNNNSNNTDSDKTNNNNSNNTDSDNTNNNNSNNTNSDNTNDNNSNNTDSGNNNNNNNNSGNTDSDKNDNDVNQPSNEDKPSDSGDNGSEDTNTGTDDKGQISEQSQIVE